MTLDYSPLVTVLLPTRDRPDLLGMALRCYSEQSWPNRELLVLDDGQERPVDPAAVEAVGGRVVRYRDPLLLGDKLNDGAARASGMILHKWDDDDWYDPDFITAQAAPILDAWRDGSVPAASGRRYFSLFFLESWRLITSQTATLTGHMMVTRDAWETVPFAAIRGAGTDVAFSSALKAADIPCFQLGMEGRDLCILVRRDGLAGQSGHTWVQDAARRDVETSVLRRGSVDPRTPEEVLPPWAIAEFRALRERALALAATDPDAVPPKTPPRRERRAPRDQAATLTANGAD